MLLDTGVSHVVKHTIHSRLPYPARSLARASRCKRVTATLSFIKAVTAYSPVALVTGIYTALSFRQSQIGPEV